MDFSRLSSYLDSLEAQYGIPFNSTRIWKEHIEIFRRDCGYSDYAGTVPMKGSALCFMYSLTKVVVCAAGMRLIEEGRLSLADKVSTYFPEYGALKVKQADEIVSVKNEPTILNLFAMTAGLSYNLDTPDMRTLRDMGDNADMQGVVRAIARESLLFEPSTHFHYSLCHDVLGAVIEIVTGKSLDAYLQEAFFSPLGMKNTTFRLTEQRKAQFCAQYKYPEDSETLEPLPTYNSYVLFPGYDSGGAGLISCADDYIMFADALCNGGISKSGYRVLSGESIDLMRQNHLNKQCLEDFRREFEALGKQGYSYGLGVRTQADKSGSESPVGEFGWEGAGGSYVLIDPQNNLTILYVQHVRNCRVSSEIHSAIRKMTYEVLT